MQEIFLWLQPHPVLLPAVCRLLAPYWIAEAARAAFSQFLGGHSICKHPHNFPFCYQSPPLTQANIASCHRRHQMTF